MELPFERQAAKNLPAPDGLDLTDLSAYNALRSLYALYNAGTIGKDNAHAEKKKIIWAYSEQKSNAEFITREALKLNKRIKEATEEYEKNPNRETSDRLYRAFYNK